MPFGYKMAYLSPLYLSCNLSNELLTFFFFTVGKARRSRNAFFMGFFFLVTPHEILPATGVLDHEKHHGGVHFAHGGDQGAVGGPRVPVQGHQTMQIILYFTKSVPMTNPTLFEAARPQRGHDVVPGHGEQLRGHVHNPFN